MTIEKMRPWHIRYKALKENLHKSTIFKTSLKGRLDKNICPPIGGNKKFLFSYLGSAYNCISPNNMQ